MDSIRNALTLGNGDVCWNLELKSQTESYFGFYSRVLINKDITFENEVHISSDDLLRLKEYLLTHINQGTELMDSFTFVSYSLDFQVKALYGWMNEEKSEGEFPIQVLLLAGQSEESGRYYIGVEFHLSIHSVYEFAKQVDSLHAREVVLHQ